MSLHDLMGKSFWSGVNRTKELLTDVLIMEKQVMLSCCNLALCECLRRLKIQASSVLHINTLIMWLVAEEKNASTKHTSGYNEKIDVIYKLFLHHMAAGWGCGWDVFLQFET